jgi:hypothetical protein
VGRQGVRLTGRKGEEMLSIIERRSREIPHPNRKSGREMQDLDRYSTQRIKKILTNSPVELAVKPLSEMIQKLLDFDPSLVKEMVNVQNPLVRKVLIAELLRSRHASKVTRDKRAMMETLGLSA